MRVNHERDRSDSVKTVGMMVLNAEVKKLAAIASITRANFLPLAVVIVFAGLAAAYYSLHVFSAVDGLLVLVGAVLTHASVNAFNNYFDYRSGIDRRTGKTPFSGGVDTLVKGAMSTSSAFLVAVLSLIGAGLIGVYFLTRFFALLLPIMLYGLFVIVLYTPVLARVHAVSEFVAGTGFGLMGVGAYATQTGIVNGPAIAIFVPVTILVALLLFLNEFPDAEVDRAAGRRHLVILLGKRRAAGVYVAGLIATYISIVLAVLVGYAPLAVLAALVTIPIAYKAGRIALNNYDRGPALIPAQGSNVLVILTTILLVGVGYLVSAFV
jgi:1,4-dihydroxy-2-naphthoate octaprenyltransferase